MCGIVAVLHHHEAVVEDNVDVLFSQMKSAMGSRGPDGNGGTPSRNMRRCLWPLSIGMASGTLINGSHV